MHGRTVPQHFLFCNGICKRDSESSSGNVANHAGTGCEPTSQKQDGGRCVVQPRI